MTLENQAILSYYKELTALDNDGNVWLVQDVRTSEILVRKSVIGASSSIYRRLQTAQIPGVPEIYSIIEDEDRITIIEEYIHGRTLEQLYPSCDASPADAAGMAVSVCDILEQLHSLNPPIICRDIKPSNIMVSKGRYYITDFDIARSYTQGNKEDTRLLGTAAFAAPEHYGFGQTDARSDIYSLAVTMNYLITGKHPKEHPAPGRIGGIIKKASSIDPARRYQSASDLKRELRTVAGERQTRWLSASRLAAIVFFVFWGILVACSVQNNGSTGEPYGTDFQVFIAKLMTFLFLFLPYLYNANFKGVLDITLRRFRRGSLPYWIARILMTIVAACLVPIVLSIAFM